MSKLLIAIFIIAVVSVASAMEVRTKSSWIGGATEIQATFSRSECENLANSYSYAYEKAGEICSATKRAIELRGPGMGGGIIKTILNVAVRTNIARDIQNKSQGIINDYRGPISWTYSFKPNVLGKILGL